MLIGLRRLGADGMLPRADSRWERVGTRGDEKFLGEDIALCKVVQSAAKVTRKLDFDRRDWDESRIGETRRKRSHRGYFDCCPFRSVNISRADYSRGFTAASIGLL